jgi:uncharacterized protein YaeQ
MAITATIYKFDVDLSDADRQVYETLSIQAARHPSESEEYLVTRLLAYTLEYGEGIAFSRGLSDPDEPAIAIRDLTGAIRTWIEIGTPDASRLHKAGKSAGRVVVYTHKDVGQLLGRLGGERIHRADAIEIYAIDRRLVDAVALRLERRMAFALSIAERELYLSIGDETLSGTVTRHALTTL